MDLTTITIRGREYTIRKGTVGYFLTTADRADWRIAHCGTAAKHELRQTSEYARLLILNENPRGYMPEVRLGVYKTLGRLWT